MGTPIHTSRATQVSMRTMPLKSTHTHTHTQTSMPATYYPMHKCIFILLLYYGIIMYDCGHAHARMCSFSADALRIVECSRVEHAAGSHSSSSSAMTSTSMLSASHKYSRCIACHTRRRCDGQCECAFRMRFGCVCECARMMSHARSVNLNRCLRRQLGMAGAVSMGTLERLTTARAPTAWIARAGATVPCG